MKEMIKRTAACLLFAGLAAGMLYGAYRLLHFKSTDGCYPAEMFYQQEENTVDVLCLGSSHTYTNINPAILWDEYGMAAYDLAGSNQTLWNTYYYMKEALKYQTPQLVVVDVYRVMEEDEYQGTERMTMNMFGLRHSDDYVENLQVSLAPEEEQLDYLLRYPVYHARYQELKEDDFLPYHGDANGRNYKGFNINSISTTVFEGLPDVTWVTETGKMEKKNEKYLKEIIDLAKEQDIPLLLVAAPYMEVGEEDEMLYNQVAEIAAEHQVDFVDFNRQFEQIGLDPQKDFAESSHLNYYGSEKYTSYLGNYIAKHFKEQVSLESMAKDLGISKFTLSRVFSGTFHRNFNQYLNEQRLNYICVHLECTDKSITDIWLDAGFDSQRTFNRGFRERYRMTPREYRSLYKEKYILQTQEMEEL